MERSFDAPDSIGESPWLKEIGTYHFLVVKVEDPGIDKDGKPKACWTAFVHVLAGTTPGMEGKQAELSFWDGAKDKDGGLFKRQQEMAFYIATDIMAPSQLGQSGLTIEPLDAKDRQLIVTLKKTRDEKYLEIDGASIFHVDDPAASKFPKHTKALELAHKNFRHPADYFATLRKEQHGIGRTANGNGTTRSHSTASAKVNVDNL